jgi:hypothetical protein
MKLRGENLLFCRLGLHVLIPILFVIYSYFNNKQASSSIFMEVADFIVRSIVSIGLSSLITFCIWFFFSFFSLLFNELGFKNKIMDEFLAFLNNNVILGLLIWVVIIVLNCLMTYFVVRGFR